MANPLRLPMARRSLRNLVSRPATRRYPDVVRPMFPGARGTIEFDLSTCVFCGLCVRRCPAVALDCSREERWFAIEQLRCIACGVCVEICNKDSLRMSTLRRPTHVAAERGPNGERPGREVWQLPAEPSGEALSEESGAAPA